MPVRPRSVAPRQTARRAEICRTAAQVIRAKGFEATSVNDIARALGMTKAGLYHYISGKDALLFEILSFGMDQIDAEVIVPARAVEDPEERLRELVTRHARIATRAQGAVTQLVDEVRGLSASSRKKVERRMRVYFDLLRDTLAELQTAGRLRDVDLTVATFGVLSMILRLPFWFKPGRRLNADQVSTQIADLALAGVLKPARKPRSRLHLVTRTE